MTNYNKYRPSTKLCADILEKLINTNTCQPDGNEKRITDLIERILPPETERIRIDHDSRRATLIVKLHGKTDNGGIAFIGHIDTVACGDREAWRYPPLRATIKNGILFGRGASDMKSGVASMIATMMFLLEHPVRLMKPVYFCFTADEENRGMGASAIAKGNYLRTIDELFICEPSGKRIGLCEKGAIWLRLTVRGLPSHASRPDLGINAVEKAIEFGSRLRSRIGRPAPHRLLGTATASVTRFDGGISTNIIPEYARMELDVRTLPGMSHRDIIESAEEICSEMMKDQPGLKMNIKVVNDRPALEIPEDAPFIRRIRNVALSTGIDPKAKGIHFYTDASQIVPELQVPFVIMGPGEEEMAHQLNESVRVDSVALMSEFYSAYLMQYLSEGGNKSDH